MRLSNRYPQTAGLLKHPSTWAQPHPKLIGFLFFYSSSNAHHHFEIYGKNFKKAISNYQIRKQAGVQFKKPYNFCPSCHPMQPTLGKIPIIMNFSSYFWVIKFIIIGILPRVGCIGWHDGQKLYGLLNSRSIYCPQPP
jgi:hypothetical protein